MLKGKYQTWESYFFEEFRGYFLISLCQVYSMFPTCYVFRCLEKFRVAFIFIPNSMWYNKGRYIKYIYQGKIYVRPADARPHKCNISIHLLRL